MNIFPHDREWFFAGLSFENCDGDTTAADTFDDAEMVAREFGFIVDPDSWEGDGCWNVHVPYEPMATNVGMWGLEATIGAYSIRIEV